MTPSPDALDLIRHFEGCRLVAYQDSVGVWTIGYGHTGTDVRPGMQIGQAEAEGFLAVDAGTAGRAVERLVKVPLRQCEFDALVSFTFNLGARALEGSTLLRLLNAGSRWAAADEFPKWILAGGKILPGLVTRRAAERALFLESGT